MLKVTIEIDQQAQSDGLCKIKAVNNDPVRYPGMDTAILFYKTMHLMQQTVTRKVAVGKTAMSKPTH